MISRIEAQGYRCLKRVRVDLSPFHIFVGPNGSGKSTLLDVIALIADMLKNGPEQAILKRAQNLRELVWKRESDRVQLVVELRVPDSMRARLSHNDRRYTHCRYEIRIGVDSEKGGICLLLENLFLMTSPEAGIKRQDASKGQRTFFPTEPEEGESVVVESGQRTPSGWRKIISRGAKGKVSFHSETTDWNLWLGPGSQKPALAMVPEEERFPISNWAKRVLSEGVQVLALNSRAMREPCRPDAPVTFQSDGSNLPIVLRNLRAVDWQGAERWLNHVKTVLPELQGIDVVEREVDRHLYLLVTYASGIRVPSWLVSEGTLRLMALTLLAYLPTLGQIFLIEEPENGIHPRAIEAAYQSLSSVYEGQVLCATHSPLLLGLAKPSDLLCFALAESGTTDVVRGSEHPALKEWKGQITLETLYAAGVLG